MEIQDELISKLSAFHSAPFLFIGSGFSRRYLDLEDWNSLLARFAEKTNKSYDYYYSKAGGDLAEVASLIADDYHEYWFAKNESEIESGQFSGILKNISSPLKIDISLYLKEIVDSKKDVLESNEEIKSLNDAQFNGIITTNYDNLIQEIFPDLNPYIGQEELLFSNPLFIGEVYHIHGSCNDPNSLILTSEDYSKFNEKNSYLAAKLLTIFIEHPIIFIGYSLQDPNIRNILTSMASCLTNENISKLKDRLMFLVWDKKNEGDLITTNNFLINSKISIPITVIRTNDFLSIYDVLGALERKLPLHLLRQLKEQFYEFITTNKPTQKCKVFVELEDITEETPIEFVVGVGLIQKIGTRGWIGIDRECLFYDLLFEDKRCVPERVVRDLLPRLLKRRTQVPIFKYLRGAGYLDENGVLLTESLDDKVMQRALEINSTYFKVPPAYEKHKSRLTRIRSIVDLKSNFDTFHAIIYLPLLKFGEINTSELKQYLIDISGEFAVDAPLHSYRSYYLKSICLYDWLEYGAGNELSIK